MSSSNCVKSEAKEFAYALTVEHKYVTHVTDL
jgi:hypothetical protein